MRRRPEITAAAAVELDGDHLARFAHARSLTVT